MMHRAMASLSKSLYLRRLASSNMAATSFSASASYSFLLRNQTSRMELGWIAQCWNNCYSTMVQTQMQNSHSQQMISSEAVIACFWLKALEAVSLEARLKVQNDNQAMYQPSRSDVGGVRKHQVGENVSRKDKVNFLVSTLLDLKDSKEVIYGALDAWVAWERTFPTASLKRALNILEKELQWHRVIQVIKWMLSKGQGTTMGSYGQLIRALEMDHRAEEAHNIWVKKIGNDLHSVPWSLCEQMIAIYYRNNMLERLVKLFNGLEAFDRKPTAKSVVQRVADAYEILGLPEQQKRVLEKYNHLFIEKSKEHPRKSRKASRKKVEKSGEVKSTETSKDHVIATDDAKEVDDV